MKKIILSVLLVMSLAMPAFASNTYVFGQQTIGITPDGSTDYDASTLKPGGYFVEFILFKPSAAGDVIVIRDGSNAGPALMSATAVTGDTLVVYPNILCKPYLVAASCTFGTAANARITIGIRK